METTNEEKIFYQIMSKHGIVCTEGAWKKAAFEFAKAIPPTEQGDTLEHTVDEGEVNKIAEDCLEKLSRLDAWLEKHGAFLSNNKKDLATWQRWYNRIRDTKLNVIKHTLTHRQPQNDYPRPDEDGEL